MTHTPGFEDSVEGLFVHDPAKLLAPSMAVRPENLPRDPDRLIEMVLACEGKIELTRIALIRQQNQASRSISRPKVRQVNVS